MKLFKDKNGHVVLWQWPNLPLWGWLICKFLSTLASEPHIDNGLNMLSTALLFTWAYLEIKDGVNYFRQTLGAVVMLVIVIGFFAN